MPLFPKKESEIIALTQKLAGGLGDETLSAENVPVSKTELETMLGEYRSHIATINESRARLSQGKKDKNRKLKQIAKAVKADLRYLEIITDGNNAALSRYGWGARRKKHRLGVPEQPRYLEIIKQNAGTFTLDWKPPVGGGKPSAYKVQRMLEGETAWQDIATALKTEIELIGQPRKITLMFRIVAINRAGESLPSNTVSLVL